MLTHKAKYGLKALVHLAGLDLGALAPISDIASANNIPKKFLDAILLDLRKAGFVRSKMGPGGGYRLERGADDIVVGDIIRALDGPLAPIACASRLAFQSCDDCDVATCPVRLSMLRVRDAMAAVLDTMTLADMSTASRRDVARTCETTEVAATRRGRKLAMDRVTGG